METVRIEIDDRAALARIGAAMERRLDTAAKIVEGIAKQKLSTHVVTGNLIRSVTVSVTRRGPLIRATIGSGLRHALPLEYGTRHMAARPWLRPALAEAWPRIARLFND